jgi:hypothetical protein
MSTDKRNPRNPLTDPKATDEVRTQSGLIWKALSVKLEQGVVYIQIADGVWVSRGKWTKYAKEVIHAAE